jgi:serine protease Do
MKRYIFMLALMVLSASALIVLVADYQERPSVPGARKGGKRKKSTTGEAEKTVEEIVRLISPSVVALTTRESRANVPRLRDPILRFFLEDSEYVTEREDIGSGVVVDPEGFVITNEHVMGRGRDIVVTLADGRQVDAALCAVDRTEDIALIKLAERGLTAAEFGDSDELDVGQWVLAFGNPFGTASRGAQSTVTIGVISALQRNLRVEGRFYRDLIQTDAAINLGNNGGPLVDMFGKVIGLNTLILTSSGASTGVGFALPINAVMERLDALKRECTRGFSRRARP